MIIDTLIRTSYRVIDNDEVFGKKILAALLTESWARFVRHFIDAIFRSNFIRLFIYTHLSITTKRVVAQMFFDDKHNSFT